MRQPGHKPLANNLTNVALNLKGVLKMTKLYRFNTMLDGNIIYTTDPNEKHPFLQHDAKYEVKLTKKNLIDYILETQEECIYTASKLRKKTKYEILIIAELYDIKDAAKDAGAEIFPKSFFIDIEDAGDCERAYNILAERIPGFEEYYEMKAVIVDAWMDMYDIDGVTYAVYGEGELSQGDYVIAVTAE
jgi:hypothetical protein